MPRRIRPELSESNPYYIPKHRYYELKHFCLQYNDWKKALHELTVLRSVALDRIRSTDISDPTFALAERAYELKHNIEMVDEVIDSVGGYFSGWLRAGIVEERSYVYLQTVMQIPCCKDTYYDIYRKFFYELSKIRK